MSNTITSSEQAPSRWRRAAVAVVTVTVCGCQSEAILAADGRSQSLSARVGQEITITLGNVGPGTYASPPQISSDALNYLGVEVVPPFTPAGPTQRFRFSAARPGQAIVEFRRSIGDSTIAVVKDTVVVR